MSGTSSSNNSVPSRALRKEEHQLICAMLSDQYTAEATVNMLETSRVADMQDGGMGGIRFVGPEPRTFGKAIAEAQYVDSDRILVSIVINGGSNGPLFELDFWKVDFSPLRRYPKPSDLSKRLT